MFYLIEVSAYNVGVVLYQQANYATAANFFRKALEYLITYHPLEFINGAVRFYKFGHLYYFD